MKWFVSSVLRAKPSRQLSFSTQPTQICCANLKHNTDFPEIKNPEDPFAGSRCCGTKTSEGRGEKMASATRPVGPRSGHLPTNTNNRPRAGLQGSRFPASTESPGSLLSRPFPRCPLRRPRAGTPTTAGPEDAPETPLSIPLPCQVPKRTCQNPCPSPRAGGGR